MLNFTQHLVIRVVLVASLLSIIVIGISRAVTPPRWDVMAYVELIDGDREIFLRDLTHDLALQLTHFDSAVGNPAWSPDGKRLAFHSPHSSTYQLYVLDLQTGQLTALSDPVNRDRDPSWSPDGERLAFVSDRPGQDGYDVFVLNVTTGATQRLTYQIPGAPQSPEWSPDGRFIAFHTASNNTGLTVYVVDADGANLRRLSQPGTLAASPAWSPDGRRLAVTVMTPDGSELYEITLPIGGVQTLSAERLTENDQPDDAPHWSADGQQIAVMTDGEVMNLGFYATIYAFDRASRDTTVLYQSPGLITRPTWQPR